MTDIEEAMEIIWDRCQHCKDVQEALEILRRERPHGEWIEKEDFNLDIYYDCSVCGNSWCTLNGTPWQNGMNFCPNCGADMRKKRGEAE